MTRTTFSIGGGKRQKGNLGDITKIEIKIRRSGIAVTCERALALMSVKSRMNTQAICVNAQYLRRLKTER